jgi:hypothetical protein
MGKKNKNKGGNAPAAQSNDTGTDNTTVQSETSTAPAATQVTASDAGQTNMENNNPNSSETTETATPKKRIPMARVFIGGAIAVITKNVQSVRDYVGGFMNLNVGARKGYDNYWAKEDGFTNPESIMKLTPQGIGKMLAILHHRAALLIAEGGEAASETLDVLEGIKAYQQIAVAEAQTVAQQKLFADALATMTKANGGDEAKARQMLAAMAQTVPAATVHQTQTIGDSGAKIEDAEDAPKENEHADVV